jgi:dTDP-glucose 4,6-dehydratase
MLVVSTDEVYGSLAHGSATELSILAPSSAYSASKAAADLLAESYAKTYDADIIITRSVNNYGIQQHSEKFIPTIIESISSNKKVPIYGDGSNIRNWLHVEDHCLGIALAFLHGKTFEIFNFGSKDYISNLDLVLAFVNYFDANTNLISFVVDRKGHDARYSVDYSKATRELGWEPKKNLMQSIPELSSWYMKNNSIRNGMSPHEK